ncbi:enolase-phosphatase E1, partial [Microthyrium microscopicum]
VEGTICPISFVKEVMYPSALSTLQDILAANTASFPPPALAPYLPAFPADAASSAPALETHIAQLTASDSKVPALKALQGYLWRTGFANGSLRAPLYPDVAPHLRSWVEGGRKLAVFSSGSVTAQKLFLTYTGVEGQEGGDVVDLTGLFGALFDTMNAGPKGEGDSYVRIAKELGVLERQVLFLSDNVTEVRAAISTGMKSLVVSRPGNAPLSKEDEAEFTIITTLDAVSLE